MQVPNIQLAKVPIHNLSSHELRRSKLKLQLSPYQPTQVLESVRGLIFGAFAEPLGTNHPIQISAHSAWILRVFDLSGWCVVAQWWQHLGVGEAQPERQERKATYRPDRPVFLQL